MIIIFDNSIVTTSEGGDLNPGSPHTRHQAMQLSIFLHVENKLARNE